MRRRLRSVRALSLCGFFAMTLPVACGNYTGVDDPKSGEPAGGGAPGFGAGDPAGSGSPGGGAGGRPQTREEFCAGSGGGVVLPGTNQCSGDLAMKTFRFAACSCESIVTNGPMRTRSFDSSKKQTLATGGSIGSNGDISGNGNADLGGSVWSSGRFWLNGDGHVFQELHAGAGAGANGAITVDGDYFGPTEIRSTATVVRGTSHVPAAVPAPCDCTQQIPIDAIVRAFETQNDDAASGLEPTMFARTNDDHDVTLACGRYYFTEITPNGRVTFRLRGRTAIFVAGDVTLNGGFQILFEGGSELDLFVGSDLSFNGDAVFGDAEAPARVRVYVRGTTVSANGGARFAGNLYAPNATVRFNGDHATRGSVIAKSLGQNGSLDLEYDEAVLRVQGCEPPGGACSSCRDCAGATPACKGGKCAACTSNADCCAPLQCQGGACVPAIK
jgi:hypothetical protein